MFATQAKKELELVKAFQKIFYGADGKPTPDAERVLAFLRDEAGARGELGRGGAPYFYDAGNRFDPHAAAFLLGKRRMFDLIIKYLALDERDVFRLAKGKRGVKEEEEIRQELEV